jgi:uroporphyrinogen-III synthase
MRHEISSTRHTRIQPPNAAAICFTAASGANSFADKARHRADTSLSEVISTASSKASRCNVSTE